MTARAIIVNAVN